MTLTEERAHALEETIQKEQSRLLTFIRSRVRNETDAEDILQDVFYQLVSSYSITEPIEKLTSWLFTVTRNKIIDWYRKRRSGLGSVSQTEATSPLLLEEILYDPLEDPDKIYDRSLIWTELAEALDDLPEEQKEVFIMHELEGRSFKEIAEWTGEPVNTLLSRKRYAILHLRERLQDLYDDFQI